MQLISSTNEENEDNEEKIKQQQQSVTLNHTECFFFSKNYFNLIVLQINLPIFPALCVLIEFPWKLNRQRKPQNINNFMLTIR